MFQNIGWGEIFLIVVVGLIIIGPERLPGLITDLRAAVFAARKAINNAKREMDGEFGAEFDEIRRPIAEVAKWGAMGPRAALTKALFEGDEQALDDFDPKKIMARDTAGQAYRDALARGQAPAGPPPVQPARPSTVETRRLGSQRADAAAQRRSAHDPDVRTAGRPSGPGAVDGLSGGFSWDDIM